jgi:hypothetical protein
LIHCQILQNWGGGEPTVRFVPVNSPIDPSPRPPQNNTQGAR